MYFGVVILSVTLCAWISQYITCCYGWKQMHSGIWSFRRSFYSYSKWHLFSETVNKSNLFLLSFAFHICGCRGITLDDLFHFIFSKAIIRSPLELLRSDKFALVPNFLQPQSKDFRHFYTFLFCLWMLKDTMQRDRTGAAIVTFLPPKSVTECCTKMLPRRQSSPHFHATLAKFSFCGEKTSVTLSGAQ